MKFYPMGQSTDWAHIALVLLQLSAEGLHSLLDGLQLVSGGRHAALFLQRGLFSSLQLQGKKTQEAKQNRKRGLRRFKKQQETNPN